MKKRILLLFGGETSEHNVSVMGYEYVSSLLRNTEYDILPTYVSHSGEWYLGGADGERAYLCASNGSLYTSGEFVKIDAAIPLLHGKGGEDGKIQGALDVAGIPYVGADATTSAVCIDKSYTKAVAESLGIPTVPSVVFSKETDVARAYELCAKKLGEKMFIKPCRLGSSVGASPVYNEADFYTFFPLAMEKGDNMVMVERLIERKREIECAFYQTSIRHFITPPGEILIGGFYGYDEKYGGKTHVSPIADVDAKIRERAVEYSTLLSEALRLRHLGRIDFFLSDGEIYFNEINTFPGFTHESLYPRMLEAYGLPPREALLSIIGEIC